MNALLKYGGAVLASVLVVVVIATVAGAIFGGAPTTPEGVVAARPPAAAAPAPIAPPVAAPAPQAPAPAPQAALPVEPPAPAAAPVPEAPAPQAAMPDAAPPAAAATPAPVAPAPAAPGAVAAGTAGIAGRLAAANPATGLTVRTRCAACHTFDQNGANRVGPNLWNVVGRDKASVPGFNYSEAMKNAPGTWTFDELDKFLTAPAQHTPGTRMAFVGMPAATDRANLIAHLRTLSTAPVPLPTN